MGDWQDQWARVHRWYERFREIDNGVELTRPIESYEDDVLAFFVNCYHLQDWLTNDPASGLASHDVEEYIDHHAPNLKTCRALANGSKHLRRRTRRNYPKVSKRLTTYAPTVTVGPTATVLVEPPVEPNPMISVVYGINADGVTHDAFTIATGCMQEWASFLTSKGLLL